MKGMSRGQRTCNHITSGGVFVDDHNSSARKMPADDDVRHLLDVSISISYMHIYIYILSLWRHIKLITVQQRK